MALDDFVDPEVAIAVAVTAVALSPKARETVRKGMVYGLAGILRAGDSVSSAARNVAAGVQQAGGAPSDRSDNGPAAPEVVMESKRESARGKATEKGATVS